MSERPVYVYRLIVTKPAGSDAPGWQPEDWEDICERHGWGSYGGGLDGPRYFPPFRWSTRRNYLSSDAAGRRAQLLRECGAVVEIQPSQAVEWKPALQRDREIEDAYRQEEE
ncbi:MAG: hypothetical protein ACM33U_07595 [Solirubrobacterales bacterium]|nr:hypothetical protein [Solirubrobacterales bacterium]